MHLFILMHVSCFSRYIQMPRPFCFEPSNRYVVAIRFQRHGVSHRHLTAFILIDSVSPPTSLFTPVGKSAVVLETNVTTA